jgi:Fic family protein
MKHLTGYTILSKMMFMVIDSKLKNRIEDALKKLNKARPFSVSMVEKLKEQFQIEMTYNSNAIEGNSLTLRETHFVVNEGLTIQGKPLKDHLEAKDHYDAVEFLYKLVEEKETVEVTEQLICKLHSLVMKKTDEHFAGRYREGNVMIAGTTHMPPDALEVPHQMRALISWYRKNRNKLDTVELAAMLHHKLVYTHPFFDGNGRTARLLMNVVLMQQGYPLVIILRNDRRRYYRVLDMADAGNEGPFVNFVAQAVERSLELYLRAVVASKDIKGKFVPLSELSDSVGYSNKYLNLLARKGKIKAYKQGRLWLSSVSAIEDYKAKRERKR